MPATITAAALTAAAFAPFGDVIEIAGEPTAMINRGRCGRYNDLARLDFNAGGRAGISLFHSQPITLPLELDLMERHPLGSQAFLPMSGHPYLVAVAGDHDGKPGDIHAFVARPDQGVNYHRNTWHGVLMPIGHTALFAVVDWIGSGGNLEECHFADSITITGAPG